MKKFNITTDSSCDHILDELTKKGIDVIYFPYTCEGKEYHSSLDKDDYHKFYEEMRNGKVFRTSQINMQEYYEFFKRKLKDNLPIIHISLTEGLSNSINNAREAAKLLKNEYPDSLIINIDSRIASLGVGLVVDEAYKLQQAGKEASEVEEYLLEFVKRVNTFYVTDTLTYFARGGRLSKVAAFIGNALKMNVILDCNPIGNLRIVKKIRGSKAANEFIINKICETVEDAENQTLYICNAENPTKANELGQIIKDKAHFKDCLITDMGMIIGAHTGPALVAFFYVGKVRPEEYKS